MFKKFVNRKSCLFIIVMFISVMLSGCLFEVNNLIQSDIEEDHYLIYNNIALIDYETENDTEDQNDVDKDDVCDKNSLNQNNIDMQFINNRTISANFAHSMAITNDGILWGWGFNRYGQVGNGTTINAQIPFKIMDDVISVATGSRHTLALRNDGSLWGWGGNGSGQLGDGTTIDRHEPVLILTNVIFISSDAYHSMAIKNDHTLWGWGHNLNGQIGNGTTIRQYIPTKILDDVVFVDTDIMYTMAIRSDGSLWGWGSNITGLLGDETIIDIYYPTHMLDGIVYVATEFNYTVVIKDDGALWGWGAPFEIYENKNDAEFKQMTHIMDDVVSVATGAVLFIAQSDGTLWDLRVLRLGHTDTLNNDTFLQFQYVLSDVLDVTGLIHRLILKNDGRLFVQGGNFRGELGNPDIFTAFTPVFLKDNIMLPNRILK